MRNIMSILCFLSLLSCKKTEEDINVKSKEITLNKEWQGDIAISDLDFANSIYPTCRVSGDFFERSGEQMEADKTECILSKIKFDYEKLESVKARVSAGKINSKTEVFIKTTKPKPIEGASLPHQATLYVEVNNKVTDSMIIYHSINFDMALEVSQRYYYLNKDMIYLLDFFENESGSGAKKWAQYKINTSGKIILVKQKIFSPEDFDDSREASEAENDMAEEVDRSWNGSYHAEGSNGTLFDITINWLDDISLTITEDGIKNSYPNLKAMKMGDEKIKINYDLSLSDEMGVIYIKKKENGFYISGSPIFPILPGADEMPLDKIR
ncbi:hypothetical protein [Flavobacterium sp.]|uniref:hypothetical protein n=1 Tax=Flavobacterium sp. TaxID=239 RepID=UPI00260A3472|nr:hypothetical protein [Flavobacterium sp.]